MAAAVFWVRSYFVHDLVELCTPQHQFVIDSELGSVQVLAPGWEDIPWSANWKSEDRSLDNGTASKSLVEFSFFPRDKPGRPWVVLLPHWVIVAVGAAPAAALLARRRRRRARLTAGLCPECGYDLRATPDRCPECGAAVAKGELM